jgi:hypothetical protein
MPLAVKSYDQRARLTRARRARKVVVATVERLGLARIASRSTERLAYYGFVL